jgi:hypothetical protein
MRRVIFIAGTAYSGSSILDVMIGSGISSFSVGEVRALFYPTKKYHINPACGCGDKNCDIWKEIRKKGQNNLYTNIFGKCSGIETIIDSSKDPFWIVKQKKRLRELGIQTKVLLIWKSPDEFALSRLKRGNLHLWDYAWENYYRIFFSLIRDYKWKSVKYKDLALQPSATLKKICSYCEISYSPNMLTYWEKKHHILFGNTSAKYHLYDQKNDNYKKAIDKLSTKEIQIDNDEEKLSLRHRSIYYDKNYRKDLPSSIASTLIDNNNFVQIINAINSQDVLSKSSIDNITFPIRKIQYSKFRLLLLKIKRDLKYCYFQVINRKQLNNGSS